ncbi:flagellin [uncultured Devosia sp.]|uniref:flagellin N-terminal helical domain-containing protein n=1 Tax=uncultured Devosia sp. TaxID=211434 RepID=UPI00260EF814|nr:flagellin [uncultured Devosia sp.]
MADISLSKAVRANLLSLKGTADMMATTQNRLATGNKVNSALDNPSNWFTAKGLTNRASDLNSLIDSMANGIQTLEAADNGLSAMTKTLESMQSTLRQARQDKSFQTASYTVPTTGLGTGDVISFSGGAVGTTAVDINLTKATPGTAGITFGGVAFEADAGDSITFTVSVDGGAAQNVTIDATTIAAAGDGDAQIENAEEYAELIQNQITGATVSFSGNNLTITSDTTGTASDVNTTIGVLTDADTSSAGLTLANTGLTAAINGTAGAADGGAIKTVDELVSEINSQSSPLFGKIRASNDNGKLRIENQSTQDLTVDGVTALGAVDGSTTGASSILGNSVRAGLTDQFNELRDQLDKLSDDASFNGINLLRGDKLTITFNETGTSAIDIQTENGETINAFNLGVPTQLEEEQLDSDVTIDGLLSDVKAALDEVRSQASTFGSNLSIVQNRKSFTEAMINTLETGAGNLTLADMNTEAANLLALQTRQQLSQNSLSLASQADQSILQLLQ